MTTTAKPIKLQIGTPEAYDGSFETSRQWLNAIQLYLLVNEDIYNNNDKKIVFILSYMTKGSALTCVENHGIHSSELLFHNHGSRLIT